MNRRSKFRIYEEVKYFMKNKRIVFLSILLFFLGISSGKALTLRLTNPRVFIKAKPGDVVSGRLRIENPTSDTLQIHVEMQDWRYTSYDGAKNFFPAGTFHSSCSQWISYAPDDFVLQPYGRQDISYTVKIPDDARGGYYGVMFFQTALGKVQQEEQGVAVNVVGRIGSLFYVDIEGTIEREARIENVQIENSPDRFLFQTDFINVGNTYINAKGSIVVLDSNNMVKIRHEVNNIYTLPQDSARLSASVAEGLPQGKYLLVLTLNFEQESTPWVKEIDFEVDAAGNVTNIVVGG